MQHRRQERQVEGQVRHPPQRRGVLDDRDQSRAKPRGEQQDDEHRDQGNLSACRPALPFHTAHASKLNLNTCHMYGNYFVSR